MAVGGLLVNALIPIRAPDLGGVENVPVEPIYSLSGSGNRARLYEPLPLVLGRHRMFPDVAAAGFTEFMGDEQFLSQTFQFGPGDLDIDNLRVGTSDLSAYEGVTTQIARGTAVTIFAGNVDTIAGAMLDDTDWVRRVTAADTDRIAVDIVGDLFGINDRADTVAREVDIVIQWRLRGAAGAWSSRTVTIRNDSQSPVRRTISINPNGSGAWNVRVRRTTEPRDGTRERDQIQFAALRACQPDSGDYTGQTRLALSVRASGQRKCRCFTTVPGPLETNAPATRPPGSDCAPRALTMIIWPRGTPGAGIRGWPVISCCNPPPPMTGSSARSHSAGAPP